MATGEGNQKTYSEVLRQVFVRMTSLVVFVMVLIAPPLTFAEHGPFAEIRNRFADTSLDIWLVLGLAALVGLALNGLFYSLRVQSEATIHEANEAHRIMKLQISAAVKEGNGVASKPFRVTKVYGYIEVQKSGSECVVVGRRIIRKTSRHFEPLIWLGKPIFAQRVSLESRPLPIPKAMDISDNFWPTEITISIILAVKDINKCILAVLRKQDPLEEIRLQAQDSVSTYIRTNPQLTLRSDDGQIKAHMKRELQERLIHYDIQEVNVIGIAGELGRIAVDQEIQVVAAKSILVERVGVNRVREAQFSELIARQEAALRDWIMAQEFNRHLGLRREELESQKRDKLLDIVKESVARFGDPDMALETIRSVLEFEGKLSAKDGKKAVEGKLNVARIVDERNAAESFQLTIGYERSEIVPSPNKPDIPLQGKFDFGKYLLIADCSSDYPHSPPKIRLVTEAGEKDIYMPPITWWQPDNFLYEAISDINFLVPVYLTGKLPEG